MLQKYFPILEEINSPLAALAALNVTAAAAKIIISGVSNETLKGLLRNAIYQKEVEVSTSELEKARRAAAKESRALRYRATQAARLARATSKAAHRIKAVKRTITGKASLKALKGLTIETCRQRAVVAQAVTRIATNNYNAALEAVSTAIEGGDIRSIRSAVAALKAAVRTLEVRHVELRFAREMLSIALARHSA